MESSSENAVARALTLAASIGVLELDSNGRILGASAAASTLLETKRGALVGEPLSAFLEPLTLPHFLAAIHRSRMAHHARRCDIATTAGTLLDAAVEVLPEGPGPVATIVVLTPADRAPYVAALRQTPPRYRLLFDHSPFGLLLVDSRNGYVIEANRTAHRLVGAAVGDVVGRSWLDFVSRTEHDAAHSLVHRARNDSGGAEAELVLVRPDGLAVPTEAWAQHLAVDGGNRLYLILRDLSERTELLARQAMLLDRLRDAERLESIGLLAGGVAHEFNNVLGAILGYTELMYEHVYLTPRGKETFEYLRQAIDRGRRLTLDLLGFARRADLRRKPIEVDVLLGAVVTELRAARREQLEDIDIELMSSATDAWIDGDPDQLHRALQNLVHNALDAMPDGGRLTIRTEVEPPVSTGPEPNVYIAIEDTGVGMGMETLERAFDPFFSRKPVGRGTGLGLSMVYGIIRDHGGNVRIHSTKDVGTRVQVELATTPARPAPPIEESPPAPAEPMPPLSVLLVDDDPHILRAATSLLEKLGHRVHVALNGEQALIIHSELRDTIELVVLDVRMPGLSGVDVYDVLRERSPSLPVLFSTGYADRSSLPGVMEGPHTRVLNKPYDRQALEGAIRHLVEASANEG